MADFKQRLKEIRTERGVRHPSFEALDSIADELNVSIDYLIGKSDVNKGYPRHGDEAMVRRVTAYAQKLAEAYQNASPDTQAAVRAILHLEEDPTDGDR